MLMFTGYFREAVPHSPTEQERVRHIKLYVYTKDNTIAIFEPPQHNSGLPQVV